MKARPPERKRSRAPSARPAREILIGFHAVSEALRARRRTCHRLWVRRDRRRDEVEEVLRLAEAAGVPVAEVDRGGLPIEERTGSGETRAPGFCLEVGPLPLVPLTELAGGSPPRWIVALDGVEDPQNLGAIVRVADAAGARGLLLPERRCAPLTPAVSKASAGALEYVAVARVGNLGRALEQLKQAGFWVLAADAEEGSDLFEAPGRLLQGDLVLVLGAERRGLRPGVRRRVDALLRIPMAGHIGSLNVATAAAVVLFEWFRRARTRSPTVSS